MLVFAGDGSMVAGGVVLRALGQGLRVLVCPLDGGGQMYRELNRTNLPGRLTVWPCPGDLRRWMADLAGQTAGCCDMIVLQAVERLLADGLDRELAGLLAARAPGLHVVLVGQGDLGALTEGADLVTRFERRK